MTIPATFAQIASDGRLLTNLIAIHVLVLAWLGLSIALRWLVSRGAVRLARWAGTERLRQLSEDATRHGHAMLFWLTVTAMGMTVAGGIAFHLFGRDVRHEIRAWYRQLTPDDIFQVGAGIVGLAILTIVALGLVRLVRRLVPFLESLALARLGSPKNEATLKRWFRLLETFAVLAIRLTAVWTAGQIVGLGTLADEAVGFLLRVVGVLAVARLMTLACRATTHLVAEYGTRHLNQTALRRYWERITRLFPFGEHCFDAAVYISGASLIVREFAFIRGMADFGPRLVHCIGIFFVTRVVIELLQVLLNEAFGMYKEEHLIDQKGRTMVPLIHSMCQYVLYFGAAVLMLGALGVDTRPILAGAGILGLAVGLGAQSLVTDVVSGFFILFENQFLVGDYVKINEASGTVEEVGMRVTKVRDGHGKLHIIPNGQIKGVVTYSKGYVNAVVDVKMPSGSDLESLFHAMKEAGQRLRAAHTQVLADTEIHGLVEWGNSEMTIRAVTRVKPGTHGLMESEYRRMLKQVFDEKHAEAAAPALAA
jgi:small conductance mechanosensitive channel